MSPSADPGRLGRSAYHFIHPVMVAGIIVTAAADERVLTEPGSTSGTTAWLALGGTGLFLAGHAAFKATVWRVLPTSRLVAIAALALLGLLAGTVSILVLGVLGVGVVILLVAADRRLHPDEPADRPLYPDEPADRPLYPGRAGRLGTRRAAGGPGAARLNRGYSGVQRSRSRAAAARIARSTEADPDARNRRPAMTGSPAGIRSPTRGSRLA